MCWMRALLCGGAVRSGRAADPDPRHGCDARLHVDSVLVLLLPMCVAGDSLAAASLYPVPATKRGRRAYNVPCSVIATMWNVCELATLWPRLVHGWYRPLCESSWMLAVATTQNHSVAAGTLPSFSDRAQLVWATTSAGHPSTPSLPDVRRSSVHSLLSY